MNLMETMCERGHEKVLFVNNGLMRAIRRTENQADLSAGTQLILGYIGDQHVFIARHRISFANAAVGRIHAHQHIHTAHRTAHIQPQTHITVVQLDCRRPVQRGVHITGALEQTAAQHDRGTDLSAAGQVDLLAADEGRHMLRHRIGKDNAVGIRFEDTDIL